MAFVSLAYHPMAAFPTLKLGRRPHHMVSGLARCSFTLRPARSLTRFLGRAFGTKGFTLFIASQRASAATGWSVSCRVGLVFRLSHWSPAPFHGALKHALSHIVGAPMTNRRIRKVTPEAGTQAHRIATSTQAS